ncbi:Cell division protein PomZ [Methylococcales bacterium]|nr:Cell division protein PomZ [Methylococcales bacterium]
MKTIAFFNNKGGVGKTSLVYHLAWMFADRGLPVVAVDLDPQANLTSMFLDEDRLEELWPDNKHPDTIFGAIQPILRGIGDINEPHLERITERLGLVVGDLGLSRFEDKLSAAWPLCHNKDEAAFRVMTAFHRVIERAVIQQKAELALIDVGPNLGAINRAAIIASERVVLPLAPDLFSLQGLKNLGPTLREWRSAWRELLDKAPKDDDISLPKGEMNPSGYVIMQHSMRDSRPVKAYKQWMDRIPSVYREAVLDDNVSSVPPVASDPYCLATLKHYRSLMPMAMEVRKPMFFLKPADGAIGAHVQAVKDCYDDFKKLADKIAAGCGIALP